MTWTLRRNKLMCKKQTRYKTTFDFCLLYINIYFILIDKSINYQSNLKVSLVDGIG